MGTTPRDNRWLPGVLAAIGFLSSAYLEYLHVRAWLAPTEKSVCTVSSTVDCTTVALSPWSSVLGIPLPTWGALGFWLILVAVWRRSRWVLPLTLFSAVASVGLLAIELLLVRSVCLFCESVHVTSWLLLLVVWRMRHQFTTTKRDVDTFLYGLIPAAGLMLAVYFAVPPYWKVPTWGDTPPIPTGVTQEGKPWIGATKPLLTVEEWVDYGCPHCRASTARTLRLLAGAGSRVRLVRRNNPRMQCEPTSDLSCLNLRVALCAQKMGHFWQMDRWLFEHQGRGARVDVEAAAAAVHLDPGQLQACLVSAEIWDAAVAEAKAALHLRILDTPTYRIDGKKISEQDVLSRIRAGK